VAKSVKGVQDVKNAINVVYKSARPAFEIEKEIEARLANDVLVDDYLINTEVKNNKAILTGTVGSAQEKRRAGWNAWVAGVKDVDAEGLRVRWWARDKLRRKTVFNPRSDDELESAVRDALLYDPRVSPFQVDVDATWSTVTLSGTVDNLKAKRAAEQDARNTVGVWRVRNNLRVRPAEIPSNEELEKRVVNALFNDPYVERYDITVSAFIGTVYLSGKVNTSFEKNRAEDVAQKVNGVVYVVNIIVFEHRWAWKPDWEIRENVKDQFYWNPYVDDEQVSMTVDDGVVTLTGTVDTWSERRTAEKNAYEGGAKDVMNNLNVNYRGYGPHKTGDVYELYQP
jgi:osmotically-inducible protein OsmY